MDYEKMVREAYEHLERWDVERLLEGFAPDAKFFVPGQTRISGDHRREAIADALKTMRALTTEGFRRKLLGVVPSSSGALAILHEYVTREGEEYGYHTIHDWDVRDGKVTYWWIYVHEYDAFARAWA